MAVSSENAGQLDDILATAWRHGIRLISMTPMVPRDANTYKKSIMADYETFQSDINIVLAKWTETGMTILASLKKWEMPDLPTSPPCPYIDNTLFINENAKSRCLCCGPLSLPMEPLNYPKNIFWNSFPLRYLRYLHLCLRTGDLPAVCNECWLMNTKLYADGLASRFSDGWNTENEEAYSLYRTASRLKQDGRTGEAENLFSEALRYKSDSSLKGKIFFHLGELRSREQKYSEALPLMKLAVQHCFDHRKAFIYLYLLMALLEEPKVLPARRPARELVVKTDLQNLKSIN